ncbi:hypothetical protein [Paratissierella segnis]|jgi:hypothetical protein|uniref:Uncharacterized protein n=1 Tax=Paratissierella segnis TaxID=2763679 RepID=A0A926EVA5_9FIRM|nr:hypothetical protein [Paratissierella segnis]MBC8587212.1 hypothetical protein [Paratissierella segnis]
MEKNIRISFCILGSFILAFLNHGIFERSRLGLFPGGYGSHVLGVIIVNLANIVSLVGFLLIIVFSVILIINNIDFSKIHDKKD